MSRFASLSNAAPVASLSLEALEHAAGGVQRGGSGPRIMDRGDGWGPGAVVCTAPDGSAAAWYPDMEGAVPSDWCNGPGDQLSDPEGMLGADGGDDGGYDGGYGGESFDF